MGWLLEYIQEEQERVRSASARKAQAEDPQDPLWWDPDIDEDVDEVLYELEESPLRERISLPGHPDDTQIVRRELHRSRHARKNRARSKPRHKNICRDTIRGN